jgi:endonuclease/exonuclease/phosphatase family metal-dependent hydrolase
MRPHINPLNHLHVGKTVSINRARPRVWLVLLILATLAGMTTRAAHAGDLNVMTWNIRGGQTEKRGGSIHVVPCTPNTTPNYLHNIEEEINRHEGLDVIALQEVYRSQAETLARNLAASRGFHPRPYFVETRSCAGGPAANDFGIAIISRHPFLDVERRALYTPLCNQLEERMLARVIIKVQGRPIHVYNTHLSACGGAFAQTREVIEIRAQINRDRDRSRDFAFRPVLMGDFNVGPGSIPYQTIRLGLFLDAWREVHGDAPGNTFDTFSPHARIDYILVGSGGVFKVDYAQLTNKQALFDVFDLEKPNAGRDFNKVPDHLPVVAHMSYR